MGSGDLSRRAASEESTVALITRFRSGDRHVLDTLRSRYLAPFRRWAQCHTPAWARDSLHIEPLVERSLKKSLDGKDQESSAPARFQTLLRRKILDDLDDELHHRKPPSIASAQSQPSALEKAIGRKAYDRYESALRKLSDEDREAIIARIELDFPYSKVAEVLGTSIDEAREAVIHALLRLVKEMGCPK
jgi:DNA-directed RNA polymerase specialized sigma24 family protein